MFFYFFIFGGGFPLGFYAINLLRVCNKFERKPRLIFPMERASLLGHYAA